MSGVRGFVGVTDNSWYRLLADRPDLLGEVNFWRPGGGGFRRRRLARLDSRDKRFVYPCRFSVSQTRFARLPGLRQIRQICLP